MEERVKRKNERLSFSSSLSSSQEKRKKKTSLQNSSLFSLPYPALAPQQVETAHLLPERQRHLPGDLFFLWGQKHRKPELLPVGRARHLSVDDGGLAGLGVRVARAYRVDFHVGAARGEELLDDVGAWEEEREEKKVEEEEEEEGG